ncbi:MAG: hypothetical protein NTV52_21305 [Acidobacteria bacterium]|nr:hypothetical protein [Acidobacteriota bacterium]
MAIFHPGYVTREMIDSEIEAAIKKLGPEVVRVRYNIGVDWKDDPCINFRIVITDAASHKEVLGGVSSRVRRILSDELSPIEKWSLRPYYSFRNQSEQAQRDHLDLEWV